MLLKYNSSLVLPRVIVAERPNAVLWEYEMEFL